MGTREVVTAASDRLPGHRETTCPCIPSTPAFPPSPLSPSTQCPQVPPQPLITSVAIHYSSADTPRVSPNQRNRVTNELRCYGADYLCLGSWGMSRVGGYEEGERGGGACLGLLMTEEGFPRPGALERLAVFGIWLRYSRGLSFFGSFSSRSRYLAYRVIGRSGIRLCAEDFGKKSKWREKSVEGAFFLRGRNTSWDFDTKGDFSVGRES